MDRISRNELLDSVAAYPMSDMTSAISIDRTILSLNVAVVEGVEEGWVVVEVAVAEEVVAAAT